MKILMTVGYQDPITDEMMSYNTVSFGNVDDNDFNKIVRNEMKVVAKLGADVNTFSYVCETIK